MQQSDLVNQIVAKVMAALPAAQSPSVVASPAATQKVAVEIPKVLNQPAESLLKFDQKIITGDLIEAGYKGQKVLEVPANSIITPTAQDVVRKLKLTISHPGAGVKSTSGGTSSKLSVNILHQNETTKSLIDSLIKQSGFNRQIVGNHAEQLEIIRSQICRGEFNKVVGFNKQPHRLACELNRNEQLRAMAICHKEEWDAITKDWQPNVICISPEQQSFINLRQLLMAVLSK